MAKGQKQGWHWPEFHKPLCGAMSDRERLGLPDHYAAGRFDKEYPAAYERLRHMQKATLVTFCNQSSTPLVERLAAGNLLAVIGDPRIETMKPAMVRIEGGEIEIGLPSEAIDTVLAHYSALGLEKQWIAKECPRHKVSLKPYAIGKYPVTQREYRDFLLDSVDCELPTSWALRRFPLELANHPVYTISAEAADRYCRWLSKKTRRAFRLPSEAEWEYAASGSSGYEFPWGNDFRADAANTVETGLFQTTSVGIFPAGNSPFGVCDMAGNVEEYVVDNYAAYPGGEFVADHLVDIQGTYRIARGGSFARFRDLARTRRRHGHNPRSAVYAMGFRLAEDV